MPRTTKTDWGAIDWRQPNIDIAAATGHIAFSISVWFTRFGFRFGGLFRIGFTDEQRSITGQFQIVQSEFEDPVVDSGVRNKNADLVFFEDAPAGDAGLEFGDEFGGGHGFGSVWGFLICDKLNLRRKWPSPAS